MATSQALCSIALTLSMWPSTRVGGWGHLSKESLYLSREIRESSRRAASQCVPELLLLRPRALAATSVPTLPPPHSCWDELSPQRTWLLCYPLVALHSRSPGGFARSKRPDMMCPVSLSRILSHLLPHALPSRSPPNTHDASHLHAAAHAVPLCLRGTPPTSTDSTAIQP